MIAASEKLEKRKFKEREKKTKKRRSRKATWRRLSGGMQTVRMVYTVKGKT